MTDRLTPDSKLATTADIEARIQSIHRQRNAECERPLHDRRTGVTRGGAVQRQLDKLRKFDARLDALRARAKAL
jgi:hypothetical protein